jgi:hypothetical protein
VTVTEGVPTFASTVALAPVIVAFVPFVPFVPLVPLTPFLILTFLPSENVTTFVPPLAVLSETFETVTEVPFVPLLPVSPLSPLSPFRFAEEVPDADVIVKVVPLQL